MNKAIKAANPARYGSVQLVARIYGISGPAVVRILKDFQIEHYEICRPGKVYGRRLVNLEAFQEWFESQKVRPKREEAVAA